MRKPLTTTEAAKVLGVTKRRVAAMLTAGVLKGFKVGRDWGIDPAEVARVAKIDRPRGRPAKRTVAR